MKGLAGSWTAALLLAGCHAELAAERDSSWAGATFALVDSPSKAVALGGLLGGAPVEVRLELARAMSMATEGCFAQAEKEKRRVRVPLAAGGFESREEGVLPTLKLGTLELKHRRVAKVPEPGPCVVTLGEDVLATQAFELDLERGQLRFIASKPRAHYDALATGPRGPFRVELSRDPRTDFVLMPVGLRGAHGESTLSPFLLSLGLETSVLSRQAAQKLGGGEGAAPLAPTRVELLPSFARADVTFTVAPQWSNPQCSGILGRDVWKGLRLTVDLPAQRILLTAGDSFDGIQRPRPPSALPPTEAPEPAEPGE